MSDLVMALSYWFVPYLGIYLHHCWLISCNILENMDKIYICIFWYMYLNSSWPYSISILVNISSGNGLLLAHYQAIAWSNADLLSIEPLRTTLSVIWIKTNKLLPKHASEDVVGKNDCYVSRPECVKVKGLRKCCQQISFHLDSQRACFCPYYPNWMHANMVHKFSTAKGRKVLLEMNKTVCMILNVQTNLISMYE